MDSNKASWILEFVLRENIEENLVKAILFSLPNSSVDSRLKKTLLLRRIDSDLAEFSISGKTLQSLELIEELDRTEGKNEAPDESLKEAYCAVVAECTMKPLRESSTTDFFDVVRSLWMYRIADLKQSEAAAGLISDRLDVLGSEFGQVVVNPSARAGILVRDTKREAMDSLRKYRRETLEAMGPPLLQLVAEGMIRERETAVPAQEIREKQMGTPERHVPDRSGAVQPDHLSLFKGNKSVTAQVQGSVFHRTAYLSDISEGTESSGMDASKDAGGCPSKYNIPPTPEFNKLKKALKMSSLELQTIVEDPLPDAMAMAAEVLNSMVGKQTNATQLEHNPNQADVNVPDASVDNGTGTDNLCKKDCEGKARPSLMDRNPTAHTFEWGDDSIESSSEGSHSSKKAHLSSPSKRAISPLKVREASKFIRRRMKKRWSTVEEDTLREGVKRYGKGSWKLILKSYLEIFEERTEVDLKDKWRNMTRQ